MTRNEGLEKMIYDCVHFHIVRVLRDRFFDKSIVFGTRRRPFFGAQSQNVHSC